jgi:carboxylesterase type B
MLAPIFFLFAGLLGSSSAASSSSLPPPTVSINHGYVVGTAASSVEYFLGIPYGLPPTGTRRLAVPTALTSNFGTITATAISKVCYDVTKVSTTAPTNPAKIIASAIGAAYPNASIELFAEAAELFTQTYVLFDGLKNVVHDEDCLNLNVQRPIGTTPSSSLPVVVWIYGGGFAVGSTDLYDAAQLIQKSIDWEAPFIFVSMNYRSGAFGFLPGKQMQSHGATNLGLRDQRLALQWVQVLLLLIQMALLTYIRTTFMLLVVILLK